MKSFMFNTIDLRQCYKYCCECQTIVIFRFHSKNTYIHQQWRLSFQDITVSDNLKSLKNWSWQNYSMFYLTAELQCLRINQNYLKGRTSSGEEYWEGMMKGVSDTVIIRSMRPMTCHIPRKPCWSSWTKDVDLSNVKQK